MRHGCLVGYSGTGFATGIKVRDIRVCSLLSENMIGSGYYLLLRVKRFLRPFRAPSWNSAQEHCSLQKPAMTTSLRLEPSSRLTLSSTVSLFSLLVRVMSECFCIVLIHEADVKSFTPTNEVAVGMEFEDKLLSTTPSIVELNLKANVKYTFDLDVNILDLTAQERVDSFSMSFDLCGSSFSFLLLSIRSRL